MSDEKRQPDVNNPADLAATSAGLNATRAERAADYANRAVGYVDARARDADRMSRWTVAVALSVAGVIIAAVIALTSQVFALAAEVDDLRNDVRQDATAASHITPPTLARSRPGVRSTATKDCTGCSFVPPLDPAGDVREIQPGEAKPLDRRRVHLGP